jgi:uncharacterized protein YndB with AHSA1/START domain
MSTDKPFRVEVIVDAPRDVVWRALTEPERIRHWFGWEYDGLDEEIDFIFVRHATLVPPDRIELADDGMIELEDLGARTLIRAIKPGDVNAAEWQDVYGDIEEGWITFFNQLRHRVAFHPDSSRRMIVLRGTTGLPALPGEPWHESRYQRGAVVDGELAVVIAMPEGDATQLVTTNDHDDDAFAAAQKRWTAWWQNLPR